jgi:hypothetical protein
VRLGAFVVVNNSTCVGSIYMLRLVTPTIVLTPPTKRMLIMQRTIERVQVAFTGNSWLDLLRPRKKVRCTYIATTP